MTWEGTTEAIRFKQSVGFGNRAYYCCQCSPKEFCKANHSGELYLKAEADAEFIKLKNDCKLYKHTIERLEAELKSAKIVIKVANAKEESNAISATEKKLP